MEHIVRPSGGGASPRYPKRRRQTSPGTIMGLGRHNARDKAASKMRTPNFDGTHSRVELAALAALAWPCRWLLKFVPSRPCKGGEVLIVGCSSGDGRKFNCDTINVQQVGSG